jgi:hypothetical protein
MSDGPLHPKYASLESRIQSFDSTFRSMSSTATITSLADAGLYYFGSFDGFNDAVKCFHCDTGLLDFKEGDIPLDEHAYSRPDCPYVVANIRRDFTPEEDAIVLKLWHRMSMVKYIATIVEPGVIDSVLMSRWKETRASYDTIQEFYAAVSSKIESMNPGLNPCKPSSDVDTCKVCLDNQITVLFSPCTHLVCCAVCSQKVTTCPYCRAPIFGRLIARFT